jgi:hypothetical protein
MTAPVSGVAQTDRNGCRFRAILRSRRAHGWVEKGREPKHSPDPRGLTGELVTMADFPMISPLADAEIDAVTGGNRRSSSTSSSGSTGTSIRQNARGGDSISYGGNGGAANATTGAATGGAGGASTAAAGGIGGTNTITGPL